VCVCQPATGSGPACFGTGPEPRLHPKQHCITLELSICLLPFGAKHSTKNACWELIHAQPLQAGLAGGASLCALVQMCPWARNTLSHWVRSCLLQSVRGGWADPQIRMAGAAGKPADQLPGHWVVEWLSALGAMTQVSQPHKRTDCSTALQNIAGTRVLCPMVANSR
jgi:hypothetical protein